MTSVADELRAAAALATSGGIYLTREYLKELAHRLEPDYRLRDASIDATARIWQTKGEAIGRQRYGRLSYHFEPTDSVDAFTWEMAYQLGLRCPRRSLPAIRPRIRVKMRSRPC